MEYEIYGPFEIPRTGKGLISTAATEKREFWEAVEEIAEGLPAACGCYVFTLRPPGGAPKPWYVGRTKNQAGFRGECFAPHKINHYNNAISGYERAVPELYLIAKVTPTTKSFAKPSVNNDRGVEALEDFLIGIAYTRNRDLTNIRGTQFLKEATVPGVLNTPPGKPSNAASALKRALGL